MYNKEKIEEKQVKTNPKTWNGKADISWYTKDPYKTTFDISTPNELAGLALLVNNDFIYYDDTHQANATSGKYSVECIDFEGKTIVLNNDILLNENVLNADGTLNEAKASTFVEWEIIGIATYINSVEDYVTTFKGTIDGNNKTISGIYINDVTKFGAGFVSTLENGIIENLTIANSYIYGERFVGGIVGVNTGGNIYNCASEDNLIVGNSYRIGGIDGFAYTNKNLKYCYNLFPLSTGGGISGRKASIYTIDSCYNIDSKRFGEEVTETNPGTIDSSQKLTPGVTINGETHTTLLDALNAWVDANKSVYPDLKNWKMKNGYPVFVDSI